MTLWNSDLILWKHLITDFLFPKCQIGTLGLIFGTLESVPINQLIVNLWLQRSKFWPARMVLFPSPTPKICINRVFNYPKICIIWDFYYPKICITVEGGRKINRLIRFDERGFDCSSHVIFDYTGANFDPYLLRFLKFYGIITVTNVVFWMILSCCLDDKYWFDHTFDHLRLRTVRTRCDGTYEKGFCSDTKAPKNTKKPWFYKYFCIRDQEVARSNYITLRK